MPTIDDVKGFWEENPLWTGESKYKVASKEFFIEHDKVCIEDCQAGKFDLRAIPEEKNRDRVLDLGCGIGFWTVQLSKRGCTNITAADLTEKAIKIAKLRCEIFGIEAEFYQQNAEKMTFENNSFSHVNCQGVIHHTPDTRSCITEISRVLRKGGTANISVYYKNIFLRLWPFIGFLGVIMKKAGFRLKGRGRDSIYAEENIEEIVRLYDGSDNPIGKAYSKTEFISMLSPYFIINETYLHFFPSRTLPFKLPTFVKRFLDKYTGFMIYASLTKK